MGRRETYGIQRPLFWGGAVAVILTAIALSAPLWVTLSLAAVAVMLFWWHRSLWCVALTVAFLLLSVGYRHVYIDPVRHLDGQEDTVTGVVVEIPTVGEMYTVRVTDSDLLPTHSYVAVLWEGEDMPALYDVVETKVCLHAVAGGEPHNSSFGAVVRAFPATYAEDDMVVVGSVETAAHRWMSRARQVLVAPCRDTLGGAESGILAAVCFGDRSFLDTSANAAFRGSGLSHLLVVSGLHVSMVALALRGLLRRLGRHLSCALTLAGMWWFAWLVGFSPSVLRATVMCSLWLIGRWWFLRADGLNSLGLAAMVVLAAEPYAVYHGGFQLSFAATLGVLLLAPRLMPRYEPTYDLPWWSRLWHGLRQGAVGGAAACVSALLFTLPIAVYHYGGFALTTVVSNLLAVAPVGIMMALGWLGSVCCLVPFLGWLGRGLLLSAGLLARYVGWVAQICSPDWAWIAVPHRWQVWLIGGLCLVTVCGILCRVSCRRLAASVGALAVLAACVGVPLTTHSLQLTVLSLDNEGAFILTHQGHSALLLTHGKELDEAAYNTTALDPDVIFLGDAFAADVSRLSRFPDATVLAAPQVAEMASGREMIACPVGATVTLWEGCRLTPVTAAWWRLCVGTQTVDICTDPSAAPIGGENLRIYVGGTPACPPAGRYTVVCSEAWLRRRRPSLTGRETFILDQPITYIPQQGEWRALVWQ